MTVRARIFERGEDVGILSISDGGELDVSEITDGHAADVLRGIFISLDLEKPTPDGTVQFYPPGSPPWSSWVLSTILPQRSMLRADIEA